MTENREQPVQAFRLLSLRYDVSGNSAMSCVGMPFRDHVIRYESLSPGKCVH